MKLIVGLGNPGIKYERTRHNVGFMVVEQFLKDFEPVGQTVWTNEARFKSDIATLDWQRRSSPPFGGSSGQAKQELLEKVVVVKPKTYMNNSGLSVQLLSSQLSVLSSNIWIIHDDVDLPMGAMRIRFGGASAGHHGVESVIKALNTDKFWRFRMGIGLQHQKSNIKDQKFRNVEDYVLAGFKGAEWGKARELIKRGAKAIEMGLEQGLDAAMNRFNTK